MPTMARNDRVRALREQARRLERNAGKKISRLRGTGVELSGTQFDVRKGAGAVQGMRSRDLERHIKRLSEFTSRRSRFMQTDQGPAGPDAVNRLMKAQNRLNAQRRAKVGQFGDIKSPISDETMNQRWGVHETKQRRMNDPAQNNIFREVDKKNIKFRTPDALIKLAQTLERQATPEYESEQREKNRETLDKIMKTVHMPELQDIVDNLTDEQFDLLWFNPDFMTGQGFIYAQVVGSDDANMSDSQLEAMDLRVENEMEEALEIARWAANH